MKLNKKIITVLLILFLILFINVSSVFAESYTFNDKTIELPTLPLSTMPTSHYIIRYDGYWKAYGLWVAKDWTSEDKFYRMREDNKYISTKSGFRLYRCYLNDTSKWVLVEETSDDINFENKKNDIIYSTDNIYENNKSTIFF